MTTLIIDGNNTIYRMYYVAKSMSDGGDAGLLAVHMFISAIKNYCELYRPTRIICCWDRRIDDAANFRIDMLPEYKGTRDPEKSKEVHKHNDLIIQLLESLGVPSFYPGKLEADDCIAYLCEEFPADDKIIISVDKDLYQLVNENTVIYSPIKKVEINKSNFTQHTDFAIEDYLTAKCLQGDKSDNVSGIKGFGPRKIEKYLAGEVTLDDAQQKIADRNRELFRLDMYKNHPDEVAYYKSQSLSVKYNMNEFERLCKENSLKHLLNGKDRYFSIFCTPSKLIEMFS